MSLESDTHSLWELPADEEEKPTTTEEPVEELDEQEQ